MVALEYPPEKDWQISRRMHPNGLFDGNHPFSERIPPNPPGAIIPVPPGVPPAFVFTGESATLRGTGFVHFDIDPQNSKPHALTARPTRLFSVFVFCNRLLMNPAVLLGNKFRGPQSDHHAYFPTLKLGDFGSGMDILPETLRNR